MTYLNNLFSFKYWITKLKKICKIIINFFVYFNESFRKISESEKKPHSKNNLNLILFDIYDFVVLIFTII